MHSLIPRHEPTYRWSAAVGGFMPWYQTVSTLFPSSISGRGYKIGPVCVSVSERSYTWTVWCRNLEFGAGVDFDNISDKVIGQRSRSPFWKTWFSYFFLWCDLCRLHRAILSWHLTSCDVTARRHDVTAWRFDILWQFLGKNTDKEGMSWEGASTLRRFHILLVLGI